MAAVFAVLNGLTLLILLYLAALTYRHMRRAAGHAHNLWAADTAITDPEMRRAAAADAHLRAGGR